jgi:hypothetical protein
VKLRLGLLLWLGLLALFAMPSWGAVVPDGSVVKSEDQAPSLPVDAGTAKSSKLPGSSATKPKPKTKASEPKPSPPPRRAAQGNPSPSGAAFGGRGGGDTDNPGESRPLVPLAPAPVSTASTTPLWAALAVFLVLAVGGFWLAQQRNQD